VAAAKMAEAPITVGGALGTLVVAAVLQVVWYYGARAVVDCANGVPEAARSDGQRAAMRRTRSWLLSLGMSAFLSLASLRPFYIIVSRVFIARDLPLMTYTLADDQESWYGPTNLVATLRNANTPLSPPHPQHPGRGK